MSTPEEQGESRLTRKHLRELRLTGSTPIIESTPTGDETAAPAASAPSTDEQPAAPTPAAAPIPPLPRPRAADPIAPGPLPIPDAQVDLGVSPLTRRQAREQERIRTASVPVITPDVAAAHAAASAPVVAPSSPAQEMIDSVPASRPESEEAFESLFAPVPAEALSSTKASEPADEEPADDEIVAEVIDDAPADSETLAAADAGDDDDDDSPTPVVRPVLRPEFGSELLAGGDAITLPPSFDQLIARNATSTGSQSTPNALILTQTPATGSMVGPVTATGEVLITGTMALPEGLGSTGHAPGANDGKDIDSAIVDRELPPSSSPTPIAASAAISTVKGNAEIIRPPAPEKGSRLMLTLAITAGALALALVGVLILAFTTGAI